MTVASCAHKNHSPRAARRPRRDADTNAVPDGSAQAVTPPRGTRYAVLHTVGIPEGGRRGYINRCTLPRVCASSPFLYTWTETDMNR
jgi:hypothetical protein